MAAGLKQNNIKPADGVSWEDLFAINAGSLTNATRSNFFVELKQLPDGTTIPVCWYTGSGALTTSEFAAFPKGAIIHAVGLATPAIYYKTAAAGTDTWKYASVNT